MKIVDLISRDKIVPQLSATGKDEILAELAAHIASVEPQLTKEDVARVLIDRESLASTAIGQGVAIPHGKLPQVHDIVACLGRAKGGVNFDSVDGKPTYLFFVMIAPENSAGTHLKALARISRVFKDEAFKQRLMHAKDADEMFELIGLEDQKY